jgi:cytochrome P450
MNNHYNIFAELQLLKILRELFIAGTETTSTTLRWFSLFMIRKTDVQDRMRKEIYDVIGSSRFPNMADKPNLPYCEAVIHEVLRIGTILPTSLPHGLSADLQYNGFIIPKDTILIPNLYSVSFDKDIFPDPHVFCPERFLDEKGNLCHTEKVLAFSLGKQIVQF